MRRFIIFTDEELDRIKSGRLVICENCDFSDSGNDDPYDIFCVSEDWWKQYTRRKDISDAK